MKGRKTYREVRRSERSGLEAGEVGAFWAPSGVTATSLSARRLRCWAFAICSLREDLATSWLQVTGTDFANAVGSILCGTAPCLYIVVGLLEGKFYPRLSVSGSLSLTLKR